MRVNLPSLLKKTFFTLLFSFSLPIYAGPLQEEHFIFYNNTDKDLTYKFHSQNCTNSSIPELNLHAKQYSDRLTVEFKKCARMSKDWLRFSVFQDKTFIGFVEVSAEMEEDEGQYYPGEFKGEAWPTKHTVTLRIA